MQFMREEDFTTTMERKHEFQEMQRDFFPLCNVYKFNVFSRFVTDLFFIPAASWQNVKRRFLKAPVASSISCIGKK